MNDNTVINKLDNLRKLRENKKMTQLQLGMALGVTQELISRYEVGDSLLIRYFPADPNTNKAEKEFQHLK